MDALARTDGTELARHSVSKDQVPPWSTWRDGKLHHETRSNLGRRCFAHGDSPGCRNGYVASIAALILAGVVGVIPIIVWFFPARLKRAFFDGEHTI